MQRVHLRVESADLSAGLVEARAQLVDFRGLAVELCAQRGYGLAHVGVAEVGAVEALLKLVEALAALLKSLLNGSDVGAQLFALAGSLAGIVHSENVLELLYLLHVGSDLVHERKQLVAVGDCFGELFACSIGDSLLSLCFFFLRLVRATCYGHCCGKAYEQCFFHKKGYKIVEQL